MENLMDGFAAIVVVFVFFIGPIIILHSVYFSYNAKRKRNPNLWDFSEVRFWKDMNKEEFLKTYPVYPNGRYDTGFIVEFENKDSHTVMRIAARTNSGFRSIAFNKKQMVAVLKNLS